MLPEGRPDPFLTRPAARVAWRRARTQNERLAAVATLADVLGTRPAALADAPSLALLVDLQVAARRGSRPRRPGSPQAHEALRTAVRSSDAADVRLELAGAQLVLAEALAADDPGAALAQARRAEEAFGTWGVRHEHDRAASLVRALGGRPHPPGRADAVLTRREQQVLSLVGEGLSNPEIAERLFLSRRTVAHHVSSVLAKLGVRNRAEALVWDATHREPHGAPRSER